MNKVLAFLFLILSFSASLLARPYNFMLSDNNLSSSLINSIYQDKDGMIWISTENGLNRFDGTKVTIFKHDDNNPNSLAHNYVRYVYEDHKGNVYVGSYIGLQLFRRETEDFSPVGTFTDGQPLLSSPSYISETIDGRIITSGNQMCLVTVSDGKPWFTDARWEGVDPSIQSQLLCDNRGYLWMHKMNDAIFSIRTDGHVEAHLGMIPAKDVSDLLRDNEGNIYMQSIQRNLYRFDHEHHSWHQVNTTSISNANLKCIYRQDENTILVGTDGNGIKQINESTGEVSDYMIDLPALSSRYLKVHQIMRDQDGDLWMALFLKGIARIPMRQSSFRYLGSQSSSANLIGSSSISVLLSDRKGQIWVGTDGEGLYRLTPTKQANASAPVVHASTYTSVHYASTTDGGEMPAILQALFEDSEGTIWVGSYEEGCGRIDPKTGRYTSCKELFKRQDVVAPRIYNFIEDSQKRIWVATLGHGIFCYDLKSRRVIEELSFQRGKVNSWATSLLITADDQLLIGTYDGVYAIDLSLDDPQPRHVFDRSIIFSLYEDTDHQLWAGGSTGLIRFNLTNGQEEVITSADGLAGNAAYSILGDSLQSLWIGTNHGLSNYIPATHTFNNYSDADGLQGNEFSKNVCCRDLAGRLWFGGAYGISYFRPDEVHGSNTILHGRITGLYINNQPIHAHTLSGGRPIVEGALFEAKEFSLAHADNRFSIELSTVEFSDPEAVRYEYSLNHDKWTTLPQGSHLVSFSDLQPGQYSFRYRVSLGQAESDISEVILTIRPEWWESGWAYLCYALLALAIIALISWQIHRRHTAERQMLMQQHKHEIDEAKLRFFTNITHEIRTPMTLIMSPLQKLINTDADPTRQSAYQTMLRNARMLLQLANQLLDIRKIDNKQMKLVFRETNVIASLQDLFVYFQPIAEQKNLRFDFQHDSLETLQMWVDPGYFSKIIVNLLTNAFKYTNQGSVTLKAELVEHDGNVQDTATNTTNAVHNFLQISVTDTGTGIPEEDLERIFERFYRTRSAHVSTDGNGIGLHLTRSLVSLHHGTIHASNNVDKAGSTFSVLLPLGKEHLKNEEIADTEETDKMNDDLEVNVNTGVLASQPAIDSARHARTKYRLMIVDDDAEIRNYLSRELASDFHILECADGQEALDRIFKQKPDLIISDVMMPTVDGFTLCQKVKSNISLNHIPIILLTAKADQESNLAGLDSGADAYITKPFYIEILRSTALNLVKTRSQLRNTFNGKQTQEDKLDTIEMPTANDKLMDRVMRVVNQNLSNPNFSIDDVCQEVGISRVHLYRKLKELTNQSPRDFIRNVRLRQAERLLLKGSYSINEIAEAVGFSRANNFSAAFKEQYGASPLQWKAQQQKQEAENVEE